MRFGIDKAIFQKFPELNVGVLVVKKLNNFGESAEIVSYLRKEEAGIRQKFDARTLSQNPKIDCWRKAYSSFGAKPKDHQSSVENLYRRVLKGVNARHISKLVDIYNFISLKHTVPLGGEDLDKIKGDIKLTIANSNEPAVLLLGDKDPRQPDSGEVIYKDDLSAICRRFNWRESERTKLTELTTNAVLTAEGLPPTNINDMELVMSELKDVIHKNCGGKISVNILNSSNAEIEF